MVITAFTEKAMGYDPMNIQFIKDRVGILETNDENKTKFKREINTLLRLAVKTTTSYCSPIFFKKLSTPGRLMT
jgi:hypothetical protein